MTDTDTLRITYDDLREKYTRMLLVWDDLLQDGEYSAAAVLRIRLIKVRDDAETIKQHMTQCGMEV